MGPESLYCSKWIKISKSYRDLDLGPTMPNIKLVRVIFIYYNVFKFHVPRSISFRVIMQKHTHTETHAHTHMYTHTHMDANRDYNGYSIVAFCKNATIKISSILESGSLLKQLKSMLV